MSPDPRANQLIAGKVIADVNVAPQFHLCDEHCRLIRSKLKDVGKAARNAGCLTRYC